MRAAILGSYWTTAGPAIPAGAPARLVGPQWSPFSFEARCEQAARVGLAGLGLWHADLDHLLETHHLEELGRVLRGAGLEVLELEFLMDWYLPATDPRRALADATRDRVFEAAAVLGAHHVKVGNIFGVPVEPARLVAAFAELCDLAATRHDAPLLYELMPFDPNADGLDKAIGIVEGAGAANGGLVLDTWHLSKLGITPADLARLPTRYPYYVELSDGLAAGIGDLEDEVTSYRRLPGEGDFDLAGYLGALDALGYQGPFGVEVLSAELRALPIDQAFEATARTARAVLATVPASP